MREGLDAVDPLLGVPRNEDFPWIDERSLIPDDSMELKVDAESRRTLLWVDAAAEPAKPALDGGRFRSRLTSSSRRLECEETKGVEELAAGSVPLGADADAGWRVGVGAEFRNDEAEEDENDALAASAALLGRR